MVSTLTMKESEALASSNRKLAMYKGQMVAVHTVNKTEISLTRQDLVQLIKVGSFLIICVLHLVV